MNEEYDVQEPVTDVTENTEAQAVEDIEDGIELTDTTSNNEENKGVKTYTDEDLEKIINERINDILPTKIEREKRKLERDYRDKLSKYEETDSILKAGLGTSDITETNQTLRNYYKEQGINIPDYQRPRYSEEDEKALGEIDANSVIKLGFDEMQEEANRLADIGTDKMSVREKAMFTKLASELTSQKNKRELAKIGVKEDVLNDADFKEFAGRFNSKTPIKDVYQMYEKLKPHKDKVMIGSMKGITSKEKKDYYTDEELGKLSLDDLDDDAVWNAVRKSMTSKK